jgi:hypothetical protein
VSFYFAAATEPNDIGDNYRRAAATSIAFCKAPSEASFGEVPELLEKELGCTLA